MKNLPHVAQSEIVAVKNLNHSDSDELKRQILSAHPNDIFGTAKQSNKDSVAYIICPNCGNGSGKDKTPVQCTFKGDRWLYHCFAHQDLEGDLLNIIAADQNLDLHNRDGMAEALAVGAKIIGYYIDDSVSFAQNIKDNNPLNIGTYNLGHLFYEFLRYYGFVFNPLENKYACAILFSNVSS